MLFASKLGWGGLTSCALGGLLALIGVRCGRLARQLDAAIQVDSLAELKHLFALVPLLVAVTGRVLAPSPLKCEMSDTEAAIVEVRRCFLLGIYSGMCTYSEAHLNKHSLKCVVQIPHPT